MILIYIERSGAGAQDVCPPHSRSDDILYGSSELQACLVTVQIWFSNFLLFINSLTKWRIGTTQFTFELHIRTAHAVLTVEAPLQPPDDDFTVFTHKIFP
jgi:hypothetical protein